MFKVLAPAQMNPGKRTLVEFHNYWGESHGPLFANTKYLRRYVQHLSLPEAYGSDPSPTFDGVSMFWYDDWRDQRAPSDDPELTALRQAVREDDAQLFDRLPGWPLHHKRASVVAEEVIIVDGRTSPEMVKAIFIASKMPGLSHDEFFDHWQNVHGPMGAKGFINLQEKYGRDGLQVVGISVDDTVDKLKPYVADMKMNYPVLQGLGHDDLMDAFGPMLGIPVSVIISRDGKVCAKHTGLTSKDTFEAQIKALL